MNLSVALCCMLMAATASGLTMGVVSLDELELRVKERNVNESKTERGCASGATCREAAPQIRLNRDAGRRSNTEHSGRDYTESCDYHGNLFDAERKRDAFLNSSFEICACHQGSSQRVGH